MNAPVNIDKTIKELASAVVDQEYDRTTLRDDALWEEREAEVATALFDVIEDQVGGWRRADHYDHTDPYGPNGPQHDRPEEVRGER